MQTRQDASGCKVLISQITSTGQKVAASEA